MKVKDKIVFVRPGSFIRTRRGAGEKLLLGNLHQHCGKLNGNVQGLREFSEAY